MVVKIPETDRGLCGHHWVACNPSYWLENGRKDESPDSFSQEGDMI